MCGIVGMLSTTKKDVGVYIYDALTIIQHRGQDAAGITTASKGRFYMRKGNGMVRNVFRTKHITKLIGDMGIGHIRYPTAGSSSGAEAQPFYVNSPYGIAFAHNGNLTNTEALTKELFEQDLRHINTNSDSEILLNILASEIAKEQKHRINETDIFKAVKKLHQRVKGAYAAIGMIPGYGIFGFRDPHGIRPLILGEKTTAKSTSYMLASESVALTALGYKITRDVEPGEVVVLDRKGNINSKQCADSSELSPCIFEFVYFARPDSIIDKISVYKSRLRMGERLAEKIKSKWPDETIDVVMPVPDTSRTAALQLANELDLKYREGFIMNRYIARTFIMPGQKARKKSLRYKLTPQVTEISEKKVMIVDDSIVRGNTSGEIVKMVKDAGAKEVYFVSACPPVQHPCYYGVDMPTKKELIASNVEENVIKDILGVDILLYQEIDDLVEAVTRKGDHHIDNPCMACLNGNYNGTE